MKDTTAGRSQTANTMTTVEAIVRAAPSERHFEDRLRAIFEFEPGESMLCWFYGDTHDFIHARIVLTNRRLLAFGERGLVRLRWEPLRELMVRLEDMDEPTLKERRKEGIVSYGDNHLRFNPWTAARPAWSAITEARTRRIAELSHEL